MHLVSVFGKLFHKPVRQLRAEFPMGDEPLLVKEFLNNGCESEVPCFVRFRDKCTKILSWHRWLGNPLRWQPSQASIIPGRSSLRWSHSLSS